MILISWPSWPLANLHGLKEWFSNSGMGDLEQGEDSGSVIRDGHISDVVHQHFIETDVVQLCQRNIATPESRVLAHPTGPREDFKMLDTV